MDIHTVTCSVCVRFAYTFVDPDVCVCVCGECIDDNNYSEWCFRVAYSY